MLTILAAASNSPLKSVGVVAAAVEAGVAARGAICKGARLAAGWGGGGVCGSGEDEDVWSTNVCD